MLDWFSRLSWFKKLLAIGALGTAVLIIVAIAIPGDDTPTSPARTAPQATAAPVRTTVKATAATSPSKAAQAERRAQIEERNRRDQAAAAVAPTAIAIATPAATAIATPTATPFPRVNITAEHQEHRDQQVNELEERLADRKATPTPTASPTPAPAAQDECPTASERHYLTSLSNARLTMGNGLIAIGTLIGKAASDLQLLDEAWWTTELFIAIGDVNTGAIQTFQLTAPPALSEAHHYALLTADEASLAMIFLADAVNLLDFDLLDQANEAMLLSEEYSYKVIRLVQSFCEY